MQAGMPLPRSDSANVPAAAPRRVSILGATGSIGASTIDLLRRDQAAYSVEAVTANQNVQALADLARSLKARFAAVADPARYQDLKQALSGSGIEAAAGSSAMIEAASRPADWVMAAITGAGGLAPTLAALAQGRTVALANKECLVCAGTMFMRAAVAAKATLLPVDSEHNAVFQSLAAGHTGDLRRIILTASGGPFRQSNREALRSVTREQALRHPNWSMGPKITIDSATLMNKGLEVIEAHYLFDLPSDRIDVLVHPQSVIHGMVEFCDGSVIAALASPDMRIPISHCLAWPQRIDVPAKRLDLAAIANLSFSAPDTALFPALALARHALEHGAGAPTLLNAANEVAVAEFLGGRLAFLAIPTLVEAALEKGLARGVARDPATLDDAIALDQAGRALAHELLPEIAAKAI